MSSTSPSISTGMSKGSSASPAALRQCAPTVPRPAGNSVEVAERAMQASKDGKTREAGGDVALLDVEFAPELAQRSRKRSVGILRSVTGDERPSANDADELKRQQDSGRRLCQRRKQQAEGANSILDYRHHSTIDINFCRVVCGAPL